MTYRIDMGKLDGYKEHKIVNAVTANFVAPSYEQANLERWPLTDSAVTSALLAFELALKHLLRHPPHGRLTLMPLIQQEKDAGVLPR